MPGSLDELAVIRTITERCPAPAEGLHLGPGDDCAAIAPPPVEVLTVDTMVEGVHFDRALSPGDLGWKLAAVNASDIAAMGATPTWALLSLSLPPPVSRGWLEGFAEGLAEGLRRFGLGLIGGDTTASTGPKVLSLSAAGRLDHPPLRRAGAREGHDIWVSGTLGDADAGWRSAATEGPLHRALARPEPPVALGPALAAAGLASAAMDLSDGLAADLPRLCRASGFGALVEPEALPASPALLAAGDPLPHQAAGGEDYQLLFTAAPPLRPQIEALGRRLGLRLSRIGRITSGREARLRGRPWPAPWRHFRG